MRRDRLSDRIACIEERRLADLAVLHQSRSQLAEPSSVRTKRILKRKLDVLTSNNGRKTLDSKPLNDFQERALSKSDHFQRLTVSLCYGNDCGPCNNDIVKMLL